jgi:hypothetical protein
MIFNSLSFWSMAVGLIAYVVKFFVPSFPFDETQILTFTLFLLGLAGIYPQVALMYSQRLMGVVWSDLFTKKEFWVLVSGLVSFVLLFFFPTFPFATEAILALVLFILGLFQINPELRARGLK